MQRRIQEFAPQALHIATEGPLGMAARRFCVRSGMRFTTSYHTQFPQYLRARFPIPAQVSYRALRRFHGAGARCMVSTARCGGDLATHGFKNLATWQRGVDTETVQAAARRTSSRCRGRSPPMSAGWRSRRTSTPFWR